MGAAVVAPELESTGSIVRVHGLSRSASCGISPDEEWNLCLLHWQGHSLPLRHRGSPTSYSLRVEN